MAQSTTIILLNGQNIKPTYKCSFYRVANIFKDLQLADQSQNPLAFNSER